MSTVKNPPPLHTQRFLMRRREFMRSALIGSLGYGAFSFLKHRGIGGVSAFLKQALRRPGLTSFEASEILADALAFGPSLLFVSEALAQGGNAGPAVFHLFYATSHDTRNELCLTDYGQVYNPFTTQDYSAMQSQLGGLIQKAPAPFDKTLNMRAYQVLTTGTIDGTNQFPGVAAGPALTATQLQDVCVIAGIGMTGSEGIHRRGAIPLVGSLEYAMMASYQNYSPIGAVVLNTPMVNSSGGVSNPGADIAGFLGAVDVPAVYMPRDQTNNPVTILDAMTGDKNVAAVRKQMLDAHALLSAQLQNLKGYSSMATQMFNTYGPRAMEGLASMRMFGDLFKNGLATIGAAGLNSFDFHATDALRTPTGDFGNMLTESAQALAGTYYIAQQAFAAQKDVIVHFSTCSNRNETWVVDSANVSSLTFVIRGSGAASPFKKLPNQLLLMPDGANTMYADGGVTGTPNYSGADAGTLGVSGGMTIGNVEAGIVHAAGQASGQTPALQLEEPGIKILG